jgi:tetratricopeptide (TPR) repeat protein
MLPLADPQRFIGRHRQLVALAEAFEARSRWLTLLGPSGVGKSRLASEHLSAARDARRVLWVELSEIEELISALALIASRIGAPPATHRGPEQVIGEALRELGPATLVLDGVDGLVTALRDVIPQWLAASPETHVLVTSETRVGGEGEYVIDVTPLALPSDVSEPVISDGLRLWHVARGAQPMAVPKSSDPELVRLLRALGGLPFAIELCAKHAERLTPFALLERLPVGLRARGAALAPDEITEGLLGLVWQLLSEAERAALAQLSVLSGAFEPAWACEIVAVPDAASCLARLRERGLILPGFSAESVALEGLHPHVRSFARRKLGTGAEAFAARRRHAESFVERGTKAADALEGPSGPDAMRTLSRMQPQLIRILSEPLPETPATEVLTAALSALAVHDHLLSAHGPVSADAERLEALLSTPGIERVPTHVRMEASCVRAFVRARLSNMQGAMADMQHATELATTEADSYETGRVAVTDAFISYLAQDLARASSAVARAHRIAETIGHPRLAGITLGIEALIRRAEGDPAQAIALYERALVAHRSVHNLRFEGIVRTRLSQAYLERADLEVAREHAREARTIHRLFGDRAMEGLSLALEGHLCHASSELEQARACLEAARPLLDAVGDELELARATEKLACVRAQAFDLDIACRLFEQAEQRLVAAGLTADVARVKARRAGLFSLLGGAQELAEAQLAEALEQARESRDVFGIDLASLDSMGLELVRAALLRARGEDALCQAELERARTRLRASSQALDGCPSPLSFHALQQKRAAIDFWRTMLTLHEREAHADEPRLVMPLHAAFFTPPGRTRVSCKERPAMRRVLRRLALSATFAPAVPHTTESLFAAGWPEEHPSEENARLQVYAVLSNLRRVGLSDFLIAERDGTYLDPRLPVVLVA